MNKSRLFLYLIMLFAIFLQFDDVHATWWNSSYEFRRNITNEPNSNLGFAVNGTVKFCNDTIWTNPTSGDLYVYYTNCSNYVVANETSSVPYELESVGTGFNTTTIYSADAQAVYHFGENMAANDSTSNANHGTVSGATWNSSGKYGGAYDFDGSTDYIDTNYQMTVNSDSVSLWFKKDLSSYPAAGEHDMFGAQAGSPAKLFKFGFHTAYPDRLMYFIQVDNSNYNLKYSTTVIDETWHHVVVTVSGTTITVYIDGQLETMNDWSSGGTVTTTTPANNFGIGKTIGATGSEFDGKIDEVRIYSRILTSTEISELYNNSQSLNMNLGVEESGTAISTITTTARISPTTATTVDDDFLGYCYVNSTGTENLTIDWDWFVNGVSNSTGDSAGFVPDAEYNVNNITLSNLNEDDTVIFSCMANDSTASSTWSNSTQVNITAAFTKSFCSGIVSEQFLPNLSTATITPFYNTSYWLYKITSYNNSAVNQTTCLYNITANTNVSINISTNLTAATFKIKCSPNALINSTILNTTQYNIFNITESQSKLISCWADYINETQERNAGIVVS